MDNYRIRYDEAFGFHVMGEGAIGGKAQGIALLVGMVENDSTLKRDFPGVDVGVPKTLVIAESGFDTFVSTNGLMHLRQEDVADELIAAEFLGSQMPDHMVRLLGEYIQDHRYPLAVRSSGMLEDMGNHAYAGLYRTYMLSNDQPQVADRIENLIQAVKLVYASAFYRGPKVYAKRVGHRLEAGSMAVIIQQAAGTPHGGYFYPAISGLAQSRNYYPAAGMTPDEGVATIALGMGKQVVSGERSLRFYPRYPKRMIQRSSVEEALSYAQRRFYALELNASDLLNAQGHDHVVRRHISDAVDEPAIKMLAGTYVMAEHRIKDTVQIEGPRVLTFAGVLKYDLFPLSDILLKLLAMGETAMEVPVEIEFAVDMASPDDETSHFNLLQMRPMTASQANITVDIDSREKRSALCYTRHAMGNQVGQNLSDIIYVKPDAFDPGKTQTIAREIAQANGKVEGLNRNYLLVGPGRWGSADPWLGIPVRWSDISNVAAFVETITDKLNVEPSTGAHFYHNLVSLGIGYLSLSRQPTDHFDWSWLTGQSIAWETEFVAYVHLERPVTLRIDGRTSRGLIVPTDVTEA